MLSFSLAVSRMDRIRNEDSEAQSVLDVHVRAQRVWLLDTDRGGTADVSAEGG